MNLTKQVKEIEAKLRFVREAEDELARFRAINVLDAALDRLFARLVEAGLVDDED